MNSNALTKAIAAIGHGLNKRPVPAWKSSIVVLIGLFITYRLVVNFVLNLMYVHGTPTEDPNMLSVAVWHNDALLKVYGENSFLKGYLSWFLWLPTYISWFLPIGRIAYTADVLAILYMMTAIAMMLALDRLWPARHLPAVMIKTLAGVAFALNPNAQAILSQLHFEIAYAPFALLFFLTLIARRYGLAAFWFLLALSLREDIGFHLFGVLSIVIALDWWRKVPFAQWRPWLIFAGIAFAYSLAAMLMVRFYFNVAAINEYTGRYFYSHVSYEGLSDAIGYLFIKHSWIWLPGIVVIAWSLVTKNYYLAAGFIGCIPWLVLSLLGKSLTVSHLEMHYAFPFMIASAWPFLASQRQFLEERNVVITTKSGLAVSAAVFFFLTQQLIINNHGISLSYLHPVVFDQKINIATFDDLESRLLAAKSQLRRLKADRPVRGIAASVFNAPKLVLNLAQYRKAERAGVPYPPFEHNIDALMYFANQGYLKTVYFSSILELNNLKYHYLLPGTNVRLATDFDLHEAPAFDGIFVTDIALNKRKAMERAKQKAEEDAKKAAEQKAIKSAEQKPISAKSVKTMPATK